MSESSLYAYPLSECDGPARRFQPGRSRMKISPMSTTDISTSTNTITSNNSTVFWTQEEAAHHYSFQRGLGRAHDNRYDRAVREDVEGWSVSLLVTAHVAHSVRLRERSRQILWLCCAWAYYASQLACAMTRKCLQNRHTQLNNVL
jgi:hypothetical protein